MASDEGPLRHNYSGAAEMLRRLGVKGDTSLGMIAPGIQPTIPAADAAEALNPVTMPRHVFYVSVGSVSGQYSGFEIVPVAPRGVEVITVSVSAAAAWWVGDPGDLANSSPVSLSGDTVIPKDSPRLVSISSSTNAQSPPSNAPRTASVLGFTNAVWPGHSRLILRPGDALVVIRDGSGFAITGTVWIRSL